MGEQNVTRDGERAIKGWIAARDSLKRAEGAVARAELEMANASADLGAWLLPHDASPGEKISVWYGDALIQAEVTNGAPIITVRSRGKHAAEMGL